MNALRNKHIALLGIVVVGMLALSAFKAPTDPHGRLPEPVEYGIDRSNMDTQSTLAWPSDPEISPFLASEYNDPGNFEERRIAVFNGLARLHPKWFRDGFGKGPSASSACHPARTFSGVV